MTPIEAYGRLVEAVHKVESSGMFLGPGRWRVHLLGDHVFLVYVVQSTGRRFPRPTPNTPFAVWEDGDPDAPWKKWGGDIILSTAGVDVNSSGILRHDTGDREEYRDWVSITVDWGDVGDTDPGRGEDEK